MGIFGYSILNSRGKTTRFICIYILLIQVFWGFETQARAQTQIETKPASTVKRNPFDLGLDESLRKLQSFREEMHEWERAVRSFRRGHHFGIYPGINRGFWSGHIERREQGFEVNSTIPFIELDYSFHIPLHLGLGYFIGSKTTIYFLESSSDQSFDGPRLYGLPGASGGFVWNITPAFRIGAGIDASLVRIVDFKIPQQSREVQTASATSYMIDYLGFADFFWSLSYGLRFQYEVFELKYNGINSVRLRRYGKIWSFGLVWHLI